MDTLIAAHGVFRASGNRAAETDLFRRNFNENSRLWKNREWFGRCSRCPASKFQDEYHEIEHKLLAINELMIIMRFFIPARKHVSWLLGEMLSWLLSAVLSQVESNKLSRMGRVELRETGVLPFQDWGRELRFIVLFY